MEYNKRYLEIVDLTLLGTNPTVLVDYIAALMRDAYIAGYKNSRQLGLNVPIEDRAEEYCRKEGIIQ